MKRSPRSLTQGTAPSAVAPNTPPAITPASMRVARRPLLPAVVALNSPSPALQDALHRRRCQLVSYPRPLQLHSLWPERAPVRNPRRPPGFLKAGLSFPKTRLTAELRYSMLTADARMGPHRDLCRDPYARSRGARRCRPSAFLFYPAGRLRNLPSVYLVPALSVPGGRAGSRRRAASQGGTDERAKPEPQPSSHPWHSRPSGPTGQGVARALAERSYAAARGGPVRENAVGTSGRSPVVRTILGRGVALPCDDACRHFQWEAVSCSRSLPSRSDRP